MGVSNTKNSNFRQIAGRIGGLPKAGVKPAENSAAECVALSRTTNPSSYHMKLTRQFDPVCQQLIITPNIPYFYPLPLRCAVLITQSQYLHIYQFLFLFTSSFKSFYFYSLSLSLITNKSMMMMMKLG